MLSHKICLQILVDQLCGNPTSKMPSRFRAWMFTLNNPQFPPENPRLWLDSAKYCVWQLESGDSGTSHIQGYVVFSTVKSLNQLRSLCGRAHFEPRRGNHAQAKEYCTKEESRIAPGDEWGDEPRGAGHRSDLDQVREKIKAGSSAIEIAEEHFGSWVRYHRSFQEFRNLITPPRDFITFTTVYWGDPGVGKTRLIADTVDPNDVYWLPKPNGTRVFWDGYHGQKDVVIDEFFGWMPRDLMCRICDRYPFRVETKGGSVNFVARRVFITSNNSPLQWWPRIGLGPMRRRLQGDHGVCYKMRQGGVLGVAGEGVEEIPSGRVD
jgi:hypothetical protein